MNMLKITTTCLACFIFCAVISVNGQSSIKQKPKTKPISNKTAPKITEAVPVLEFPAVKEEPARASLKNDAMFEKKKVSYLPTPSKKYSPEEINKLTTGSKLMASLSPRKPYSTYATLNVMHAFNYSSTNDAICMAADKRPENKVQPTVITLHAYMKANKSYFCTVKWQGESWSSTTLTLSQNYQRAQDFHLKYKPLEKGEFSFVVQANEEGWRNLNLQINMDDSEFPDNLFYINEWSISQLSE